MSLIASRGSRPIRFHGPALLAVLATVLIAYPAWHLAGQYAVNDLSRLNVPQRMLLAWFYRHGTLPLWNPFAFAGQPLLAAGQSGPLYLPNVLYVLLPIEPALRLSYLLQELLAGCGMYAAVWKLGRSRVGAVTAAGVFVCCGFLVGHQIHTQMFDAFTWLPVLFWLLLQLLDRLTLPRILALGGCFALEVYAGHPQITFYTVFVLGLYSLLHWLQHRTRADFVRLLGVVAAVVIGLGLSAAQWAPTLNLSTYSTRDVASAAFLFKNSFTWADLAQFLTPWTAGGVGNAPFNLQLYDHLFGTSLFWEEICYAGIVTLVLVTGVSITTFSRRPAVRSLLFIAVLALVLAFGQHSLLRSVLAHAPGFDLFRIPSRYVGIVDFCLAVLAGLAIADIRSGRRALWKWVTASAAFWLAVLVAVRWLGPLRAAPPVDVLIPALWLFVAGIGSVVMRQRADIRAWLLAGLVLVDTLSYAHTFSPYVLEPQAGYTHPGSTVQFLQRAVRDNETAPWPFTRIAALDDGPLFEDRGDAFQLPMLNGYDSLRPWWYADEVNLNLNSWLILHQPTSLLTQLGVKYAVTSPGQDYLPDWSLVHQGLTSWVWENPALVHAAWVTLDPFTTLSSSTGSVHLTRWSPNRQVWTVSPAITDGWLVVSQMYDPNWHATVNGNPAAVGPAGNVLTSVRLAPRNRSKPDTETVVLTYRPAAFVAGVAATLSTLFLLLLAIAVSVWYRFIGPSDRA